MSKFKIGDRIKINMGFGKTKKGKVIELAYDNDFGDVYKIDSVNGDIFWAFHDDIELFIEYEVFEDNGQEYC